MSRAFVNEDDAAAEDDPGFPEAAARALLQGANEGDSGTAEAATGYLFGDPRLVSVVRQILKSAREDRNDRLEQLAERFIRRAGEEPD